MNFSTAIDRVSASYRADAGEPAGAEGYPDGNGRPWFQMVGTGLAEQQALGTRLSDYLRVSPDVSVDERLDIVGVALVEERADCWRQAELVREQFFRRFGRTLDYDRLERHFLRRVEETRERLDAVNAARWTYHAEGSGDAAEVVWNAFVSHVDNLRIGTSLVAETADVLMAMVEAQDPELQRLLGDRSSIDQDVLTAADAMRLARDAIAAVRDNGGRDGEGHLPGARVSFAQGSERQRVLRDEIVGRRGELGGDAKDSIGAEDSARSLDAAVSTIEAWLDAVQLLSEAARADFPIANELVRDAAHFDEFRLLLGARHYEPRTQVESAPDDRAIADPTSAIQDALAGVASTSRYVLSAPEVADERSDAQLAEVMNDAWSTLLGGWKDLVTGCERQVACVLEQNGDLRGSLIRRFGLPATAAVVDERDLRERSYMEEVRRLEARTVASLLVFEKSEGRSVDLRDADSVIPSVDLPDAERNVDDPFSVTLFFGDRRDHDVLVHSTAVANWNGRKTRVTPEVEVAEHEGVFAAVEHAPTGTRARRRRSAVERPLEPLLDVDTREQSHDVRAHPPGDVVDHMGTDEGRVGGSIPAHPLQIEPGSVDVGRVGDRPREERSSDVERAPFR